MLRLLWRATIGFARAVLQKAFPDKIIRVPDYAHASRESGKLALKTHVTHMVVSSKY